MQTLVQMQTQVILYKLALQLNQQVILAVTAMLTAVVMLTLIRTLALTIMRLQQVYQRRGAIAGILEAVLAEVQAVETAVLQKQRDMANLIAEG